MADRDDRQSQWIHALATVVAVAAIIGTVLGGLTYGAVNVTGLAGGEPETEDSPRRAADAAAARPRPSEASVSRAEKKTARPERTGAAVPRAERKAERSAERAEGAEKAKRNRAKQRDQHRKAQRKAQRKAERVERRKVERAKQRRAGNRHLPTLAADRHRAHHMQRVNLRGHYRGHAGTRLVVQRLEAGRWQRFPVTVVVRGGRFRTWIASGRPGPNRFRVVDPRSRRASAPVVITVR